MRHESFQIGRFLKKSPNSPNSPNLNGDAAGEAIFAGVGGLRRGVTAIEAGSTVAFFGGIAQQALYGIDAQVANAVGADDFGDLFVGTIYSNEVLAGVNVGAVVARIQEGRR